MGLSPSTTWKPFYGIQQSHGSRKELSASLSYNVLGTSRVYYSPSVGLDYGATWSMIGAMNVMELDVGLLGMGVYMTKPIGAYPENERKGKFFAVFDFNLLNVSIGGNMTPNKGVRGNPKREWDDPNYQTGTQ